MKEGKTNKGSPAIAPAFIKESVSRLAQKGGLQKEPSRHADLRTRAWSSKKPKWLEFAEQRKSSRKSVYGSSWEHQSLHAQSEILRLSKVQILWKKQFLRSQTTPRDHKGSGSLNI